MSLCEFIGVTAKFWGKKSKATTKMTGNELIIK